MFAQLAGLILCIGLSGCSSKKSPPPPQAGKTERDSSTTDDDEDDEDDGETTEKAIYDFGGAAIGDTAERDRVTQCIDAGTFYDRFFNFGEGKCTEGKLARVDCTMEGLMAILSEADKTKFQSAMANQYLGYQLDQCLDCPPDGTFEHCVKTGVVKTGTKLLFVKEEGEELLGLSMYYAVRPNQGGSTSSLTDDTTNDTSNDESDL